MFKLIMNTIIKQRNRVLNNLETKLSQIPGSIQSSAASKPRNPTIKSFLKMKDLQEKFRFFREVFPNVKRSVFGQVNSVKNAAKNPSSPRTETDINLIQELEKKLVKMGVEQIGYTKVPPELIFEGKSILFDNAIVIGQRMDKDKFRSAPSFEAFDSVLQVYADLGDIAIEITNWLRDRGYGAQAAPAFGGLVDYTRLAERAGFGQVGLHGCLISNKLGASFRIAAIFTSIENLPFTDGTNNDKWIWDFCQGCYKCARKCPPDAIYFEPKKNAFGKPIYIDYEACATAFQDDYGCGICISGCPFSLRDYQALFKQFSRRKKHPNPKVIQDFKANN
ncbi:MAG: 4Fe-4S dicluster domain-containing protein [Prochloraceae cyanobacterium]